MNDNIHNVTGVPIWGNNNDTVVSITDVPIWGNINDTRAKVIDVPIWGNINDTRVNVTEVPIWGNITTANEGNWYMREFWYWRIGLFALGGAFIEWAGIACNVISIIVLAHFR